MIDYPWDLVETAQQRRQCLIESEQRRLRRIG
jgi:hypothetical protein